MCTTVEQFINHHAEYDPDYLVEVLDISTEDILDRFSDKIADYLEDNSDGEEEGQESL